MRDIIRFFLNGNEQTVTGEHAFWPLTDFLRVRQGLTGTKVVCAEGDCGACTALLGRPVANDLRYDPVDACLLFLYQVDGCHVVTVEGMSQGDLLHPVQQALVDHHGSQCGFCTPGFVMALAGWAEAGGSSDAAATRVALTGNLCRCTGYLPILEAASALARAPFPSMAERFPDPCLVETLRPLAREAIHVQAGTRQYCAPASIAEAVAFLSRHPNAVVVSGGTELGVLRNKKGIDPPVLLSLSRVPGLDGIDELDDCIIIGANVTWTQVGQALGGRLPEFHRIIERFGSPQIRNVATLVGNVAHGSPIADALGFLMVMDAELTLAGPDGVRRRPLNGFYTGYKKKDLKPAELITHVSVPLPGSQERVRLYKVSRRRDLDIASFGAGIRVSTEAGLVQKAAIAFTGVGPTVVRLPRAESFLTGRPFAEATFRQAGKIARSEIEPLSDVRGSREFRLQLAENVLAKFYMEESGMS